MEQTKRTYSRRDFLQTAAGVAGAGMLFSIQNCETKPDFDPEAPNILILMPDQMRGMAMGCMGDPNAITPNLDALASSGVLLENTFANTPNCSSARATILTGKYAHQHGVITNDLRLRADETTLAEILLEQGYDTGFIGKWHLDGGPRQPGFVPQDRRQGFEFWAANECNHDHFNSQYFRDSDNPIQINGFEVNTWTDLTLEFLGNRSQRPFFLMVSYSPPHHPYEAPKEYIQKFDPASLDMPLEWIEGEGLPTREQIAAYYANINAIDDQIGRILQALEESGKADKTIVLFTSDHGDMLGSHARIYDRQPWDESVQVPGIVRFPRDIPGNRTISNFFSHVDMAPTLLGLAGVEIPEAMQGFDLSPTLLGENHQTPPSVFFQIFGPSPTRDVGGGWRGVRTGKYKYARYENEHWVYFDFQSDQEEIINLAGYDTSGGRLNQLHNLVERWMERTGDSWDQNFDIPLADTLELTEQQAFTSVQAYLDWKQKNQPA
ncbi:MAG: sulfatase-like hydrolase/transferase [Candidatus Marinimicrobia bacterium]|nr:sulfatase-like hydrolase/transferase [Candidatus Neomarinimicrobiota bacterium]